MEGGASMFLWCLIFSGPQTSHWEVKDEEYTVPVDKETDVQTHQGPYNLRMVRARVNEYKVKAITKLGAQDYAYDLRELGRAT